MNLLGRLIVMVPLVLVPSFAAQLTNDVLLYNERDAEIRKLAEARADVYNTEIDQIVGGLQRFLGALSHVPAVKSLRPAECDDTLENLAAHYPNDISLAVTDLSGKVVCSSQARRVAVSIADRPFFAEAKERFATGGYIVSRVTGEQALPFAAPILGRDGATVSVAVAYLSLKWLAANLQRPRLAPGESLIVADGHGVVLAELPLNDARTGARLPAAFLTTLRAERPGVVELDDLGRPTIYGYVPTTVPPSDIYLLFGVDRRLAFAPIYAGIGRSLALGLLSAIGALIIAWVIGVKFVRRPITHLIAVTEAWRNGDYLPRAALRRGARSFAISRTRSTAWPRLCACATSSWRMPSISKT